MNNYEYCTEYVLEALAHNSNMSVLDYGCGDGRIVSALRGWQIDAFGCDVFFAGGDHTQSVPDGMLGTVIRKMEGSSIPFSPESFDLVINNQVMEHVENLDMVLSEIHRVLKPGGRVLSMFPDKGVWREGHCGIPFLHWFPKESHARVYYALALRLLGAGHNTEGKGYLLWSKEFCGWLDKWTWYRSFDDIMRSYQDKFENITFMENHWFDKRVGSCCSLSRFISNKLKRILVRKLCGLVFVCSKTHV